MCAERVTPDCELRPLGFSRVTLGLLFLVRTTPLINFLPVPLGHMATPLLGWPEHGFRAAWGGLELPDAVVIALCVVRTLAAVPFTLGVQTRIAGITAAATAFVVLSQDAFGFSFTLYTLFGATWLLAIDGAGSTLALRPSRPRPAASRLVLLHAFIASVYTWSAVAKLRAPWLTGSTLNALYEGRFLAGPLADLLFATPGRRLGAAWGVVAIELALGPLLLIRRTRIAGLLLAVTLHALYEWTAHPDVFGWVMVALLISFVPCRAPGTADKR